MTSRTLFFALALTASLGCARHEPLPVPKAHATVAIPLPVPTADPLVLGRADPARSAPSLYDLPIPLVDDHGVARNLESFRGHPVLISMFYGSCASACPLITSDLKRIEKQLPASARAGVRILMVSFDPERDTPAVLARLKEERGVDATRWIFASASDDASRDLAGLLGIRYRRLDNGAYFHSSAIVLLDAEGRPQARLDGLGNDASPIVSALTLRN
ncbi:MAG TPA: SCO family protein [Polyangiaceae bacterium]|nr:SCO family protein [Polyangiaceae bacterium]